MAPTEPHRSLATVTRLGAAATGLLFGLASGCGSGAHAGPTVNGDAPATMHVVQLLDEPLAGYSGGLPKLAATRPQRGARLDPGAAEVGRYRHYLDRQRRAVLRRLPGVRPVYHYRWAVNGFAAALTPDQVAIVGQTPGVRSVTKDAVHTLDAIEPAGTADFLGLLGSAGVWRSLGGPARAGAGTVIGVIDTGIWPEHPSFAGARPAPARPFAGRCDPGRIGPAFGCGGALVGARWYVNGLGARTTTEALSARDTDGHGTHTAAVAAGADAVPAGVRRDAVLGAVSGVAPAARLSVYKACWAVSDGTSCAGSDVVAALDQAVADGVDVLNVSINGAAAGTPATDPVAAALYRAAQAGVFVAASVGNDGPAARTAPGKPWLTTVAAGTYDRRPVAAVRLGNGTRLTGAGLSAGVPSRPLIAGADAAAADVREPAAQRCQAGALDPARVRGRIVLCLRGGNPRLAKSAEVARAGGVAMVLANDAVDGLDADLHTVPTVHIDHRSYPRILAYARSPRPTAVLAPAQMRRVGTDVGCPQVAEFSARGPDGDVLAPDLMAPGANVLAAAPPTRDGALFALRSGTSVATPQVAGAAALVRGAHPGWSPMAVKSALVSTATIRDSDGTPITTEGGEIAGPAEYGAGALSVQRALDPGLVFDASAPDWGVAGMPSVVNSPAVVIGALAGVRTAKRTVTNVGTSIASYVARVDEPAGVDVGVRPGRLTLRPGESGSFAVLVNRVSAPYDQLATGAVHWSDGTHTVRMPIAVTPVVVAAPHAVELSDTRPLTVVPGFSGELRARLFGPAPAVGHTGWLRTTGGTPRFVAAAPAPSDRTARFTVPVPAHIALARFGLQTGDYPAGTDVDLYVYRRVAGSDRLIRVGRGIGPAATETVDLAEPPAGTYEVFARLLEAPGVGPVPVRMDSYLVPDEADTHGTVLSGERRVRAGTPTLVRLTGAPIAPRGRWLGQVRWSDGGTGEAVTVVGGG